MSERQNINRKILQELLDANELMPDQRFGQLLINCGVPYRSTNIYQNTALSFYEESFAVLARVLKAKEGILNGGSKKD